MSPCVARLGAALPVRRACVSPPRPTAARRLHVTAAAPKQLLVYVPPHPLVQHWIAVLRNAATPSPVFRSAAAELGRILLYEAVREWLPTVSGQVDTPCGVADVTFVDPTRPVKVVPVLRAGLVLLEAAATLLPATATYHVGYKRDEETLQSVCYMNKLPPALASEDLILVSDCLLATGEFFFSQASGPTLGRLTATHLIV